MIVEAKQWRDRIAMLSTETKHKEHVLEHLEILDWLINKVEEAE